jgi:molybdenum cofactor cytidylyltransferase
MNIAAIVPAAGRSERMGRPKLTLPLGETTVIGRVVASLRQAGIDLVVVVAPPADAPGGAALVVEAEQAGAEVVVPDERPPDMRASFERGLDRLAQTAQPRVVVLAPADSPGLTPELAARVVERAASEPDAIVIPTHAGRRGHPIALPWELALQSRTLPTGVGLNALVALNAAKVVELDAGEPGALDDLDTPEDYERWSKS